MILDIVILKIYLLILGNSFSLKISKSGYNPSSNVALRVMILIRR